MEVFNEISRAREFEGRLIRQYDTIINGWNLSYEG